MFRKPQNLQIQGQSTEVNPNISAGPTLPLGAPLGPSETFQPIDVSGLSQTLNKLGKVRQESIDQAAADVGTILGQMQAEGATVDQMLKKATGVAPKRLLTDLEKMIRAGTIKKVDSPAFQIAFQERRATFRVRAKYMEILSNEELLNQVAQSVSMSGLAEGEVTLQGAINDLTAEAKEDFADLGPFSDRAVFAAVAEMEERLTNELVARSRKLTRETNDALVANNINTFIMETVGGYVGEEDKTIDDVERQDFYTSILKDFAEFRGTTGDPYGEYMRHLKKSPESTALSTPKPCLRSSSTCRTPAERAASSSPLTSGWRWRKRSGCWRGGSCETRRTGRRGSHGLRLRLSTTSSTHLRSKRWSARLLRREDSGP